MLSIPGDSLDAVSKIWAELCYPCTWWFYNLVMLLTWERDTWSHLQTFSSNPKSQINMQDAIQMFGQPNLLSFYGFWWYRTAAYAYTHAPPTITHTLWWQGKGAMHSEPPRHDTQATEPVQSQLSIQNDLTFDKYIALGNSTFNSSTSVNDQWFLRMHRDIRYHQASRQCLNSTISRIRDLQDMQI